tara:strand:- start:144 stop:329 length:186 start_codon:yes stop_codon:yes gene_type:complete
MTREYACHLDALADNAIEPDKLIKEAQADPGHTDLRLPETAARHEPGDLPDPDTLEQALRS